MTTAQVVETSATVNNNSPIQDYVYPDDQSQPTFEGFYRRLVQLSWKSAGLLSGRSRVQSAAGPTLRVLNNWEESAAFVMTSANG